MQIRNIILVYLLLVTQLSISQTVKWWNPATSSFPVIEGQAWGKETKDLYDRLPARLEGVVRPPVWGLSKHSAGLVIRFRTNAAQINVRYQTTNPKYDMPHMSATGVSGVDLYAVTSDGVTNWCAGRYAFKDTVQYTYSDIIPNDSYHKKGREYRLYLPLYNGVKWLEIGVQEGDFFEALPIRVDAPLVVYGTSIAQGACASRPGMAWTSILERQLDRPLINLGFSGNGQLEEPILHEIAKIKAKAFILDCLPNLPVVERFPDDEIRKRLRYAVKHIREKNPSTPIILADHAGYPDGAISNSRKVMYERVNRIQYEVFEELRSEGYINIHLIPQAAFKLEMETTVDGTHPTDLGMMAYAEGYEKALRSILKEPKGAVTTTQPVTQLRELNGYDWELRHRTLLEWNQKEPPKTVVIGNSITHFWSGDALTKRSVSPTSWKETFGSSAVRNLGYGWDRIENVLWRVYHGELDGFEAKRIVLNIGTNNLAHNTDDEIMAGWEQLIQAIQLRQPNATLYVSGLYPRRGMEDRIMKLNRRLATLEMDKAFIYVNPGKALLNKDGLIDESYFSDGLHPNEAGYKVLSKAYLEVLKP